MENNKNIDEAKGTEECIEESKGKKFVAKIGTGFKKNWKKVATIAAIGGASVLGYVIGHRTADSDSCEYEDETNEVEDIVYQDETTV